ncbi:hypothetical protein [Pleionea sp. CnH1-48]|uniref:hypothetical protein n=1 Tax=Pleionea sp. CnH1-48 TaxID=2954494 RepID=UPI002096B1A1|nr:hypothetical protein [Pleionea sp. CnH1-48]MCO7225925.1 hypothetical protein [Pleionea sp. CnH1-48]
MPIPLDTGYVNYSAEGANNDSKFIPQLWSGKLVTKFYDRTIFGSIASTDYEGEISGYGDKVFIRTTADIVIKDYRIGQTLDYETPESPNIELNIDQAKYFAYKCDDIHRHQADINLLDNWAGDASEQMKIAIDKDILAYVPTEVHAHNSGNSAGRISGNVEMGAMDGSGASAVQLTKDNIVEKIIDMGLLLDEQSVPESGRWLVLPAWACALIKKSELKDASLTGDRVSIARNGRVGMIDRFHLYMSNNVSSGADGSVTVFDLIAGHKAGLTFASQMTNMESLKNPNSFGQLVRGLNVYGRKVLNGKYLVHMVARK